MAPDRPSSAASATGGPSGRKVLHAAFMLLGIPSFLMANALWSEMAALVRALPEGNHTGSYLLVALQASNIFPAIAMIEARQLSRLRLSLETAIWLQLVLGFLVCQAISLLWDRTSVMGGQSHSVALIALVFLAGAVNNSSSLLFYPYVARWPRHFITSLAVGEGLSGPLVSLIAAIQNVGGENPNFSTRLYYQLVSLLYLPAVAAYVFLLRQEARGKAADPAPDVPTAATTEATALEVEVGGYKPMPASSDGEASDGEEGGRAGPPAPAANGFGAPPPVPPAAVSPAAVFHAILPLLGVQFAVAGLAYGVLPAVLPIAVTGYEHASHVLQYSSFVSMCMDPAARFSTHYFRVYRLAPIFLIVLALAAVIIAAAAASPHPPLASLAGGGALVVIVNGCFTAAFAFCSTNVYFSIHRRLCAPAGPATMGMDPLEVASEGHAAAADGPTGGEQPLIGEAEQQEGQAESVVVRLQRQQGFKQSAFAVQAGAFVGALTTWLLVVNTKEKH